MNFKLLSRTLDPSASRKDKEKLDRWSGVNASRRAELDKISSLWEESSQCIPFEGIDTEEDWSKVRQKLGTPLETRHRIIPLRNYLIRIAAVVLFAAGLSIALIMIFRHEGKNPSYYLSVESRGQVKSTQLPDGSVVTLNKNSSIWYNHDFNLDSRDIILQGEAYFEVEHNPQLPFRVFTGNSVVEVTGTRFSICEDTSFVRVIVLSGSVSFKLADNPKIATIVSKDESGFIFRDNTLEKQQQVNINNISWKTGQLIFHKTPVIFALQDIAHHFNKELSVEASLNDSLTAQFTDQSLEDILEELQLLTSLSINQTDNLIVVKQ
jgi:ferric-dicitrate binding protein FerR (iron transport regulator)